MRRQTFLFIALIMSVLCAHADDSIKVSSADLKALTQRVERLEQAQAHPNKKGYDPKGRFTIGGYGEVTAKHCWFSNNYLRYGKNPEKYANDHYGEFDLPHVVIYLGYDFGKGWSVGTEIEFEHGGTESAIEIEEEEGGEYESEIERGGEVALEQFWLQKAFNR